MPEFIPTDEDIDLHMMYLSEKDDWVVNQPEQAEPEAQQRVRLTFREMQTIRRLNQHWVDMLNKFRQWYFFNHRPHLKPHLYYIVAAPLSECRKTDKKLFNKGFFDYFKKRHMSKDSVAFITKEVIAKSTHFNIFIIDYSEKDYHLLDTESQLYFNYNVQDVKDGTEENLARYMIKEALVRQFEEYDDYIIIN